RAALAEASAAEGRFGILNSGNGFWRISVILGSKQKLHENTSHYLLPCRPGRDVARATTGICDFRRRSKRIPAAERPADPAGAGPGPNKCGRQYRLSRRIAARRLWGNGNGASAGAYAVPAFEEIQQYQTNDRQQGGDCQRDDFLRPDELLRGAASQRQQSQLGVGYGVRPDGKLADAEGRPAEGVHGRKE